VEIRHSRRVEPGASPLVAGYVGRIDFHAKDCEKLLEVAAAMRAVGMPPIKLFTTMNKASPDAAEFFVRMKSMDLEAQFEVTLECTDLDLIYSQFSVLLLPSKKESFGNVIVEANSYGTPVIAARYAPGPAELIVDGKTGFLLDHYTGKNVVDILSVLTPDRLKDISSAAFDHHRNYSMEAHLEFLERISQEAVEEFDGENKLQVLPVIKASTKEKDKSLLKRLRNKVAMRIGRVAFR
jgi:glycosyltransferase involved in cell wall biosynthesis